MRDIWDRIGISASLLCVIHCLFTPALVILLPFAGEALAHGWFHVAIVAIVFPVAVWALWNGYLLHRQKRVLWMGGLGILLIGVALYYAYEHSNLEFVFMTIAGLLLAGAHLINLRACRLGH